MPEECRDSQLVSQSRQSIIALTNSQFITSPSKANNNNTNKNNNNSNSSSSSSPLLILCSTNGIEFANYPTKEILFGLTALESYLDLNAQDLEFGFNETRRDRILRTFVRNVFHFHLNEIYSMLKVGGKEIDEEGDREWTRRCST